MGLLDLLRWGGPANASKAPPVDMSEMYRTQMAQYLADAKPGGLLNPELDYAGLRQAGEVASMTPTPVGDVASGLLAVDDLRNRQYGSAALNSLGLLPFVPGMAGMTKKFASDAFNPSGKMLDAAERPTLYMGDIEGMLQNGKRIASKNGVDYMLDADGAIYAVKEGKEVGFISPADGFVDLSVTVENQKHGIGTELAKQYIKRNPSHDAGGFTPAGRAAYEKALREMNK